MNDELPCGKVGEERDVHDAEGAILSLPELVNADDGLVRRARHMSLTFLVRVGEARFYVTIAHGRVAAVERGTQIIRDARFSLSAAPEAWLDHWRPVPKAGDHDLLALVKGGRAAVEGDVMAFMRDLQNVKDMMAKPRAMFLEEARQ